MRDRSARALERGALRPIETVSTTIEHGGVAFIIRRVSSLARKAAEPEGAPNPFLDPDPDLFVADLSATHFALLNKYNVLDHHLLVLTRRYTDQEAFLDLADFEALAVSMEGAETLGFYNGGRAAGASQSHKHLQVVPLPLSPGELRIPMEALLGEIEDTEDVARLSRLPFRHAFFRLDPGAPLPVRPRLLLERYRAMLEAAGVGSVLTEGVERQSQPYNLLVTSSWMLLVPRSREGVEGVAVNALGFAGSLFVADEARMRVVQSLGPMNVLRGVALV